MSLLDFAIQTTKKYIEQMPKFQRKKYGQFFTSKMCIRDSGNRMATKNRIAYALPIIQIM